MPIILDQQLREQIPHDATGFPVTYFHDELSTLPDWAGPLHWHPDFEIATAVCGALDYQVGEQHILLEPGDSIWVNGNMLHGIKQVCGDIPDPMPNIVFSGTLIAPETSTVYQKYILPIASCDSLPYIVFHRNNPVYTEINALIHTIYQQMTDQDPCYEMAVQRGINRIFEFISLNFDTLPKTEATRIQIAQQIRFQKMMTYIYDHYSESVTLEDIAKAADVSRSEAGRCFQTYMGCSPIDALIRYRLQTAHRLLNNETLSLQEISFLCGFNSANYFSRQFKKVYGCAPGQNRKLGK